MAEAKKEKQAVPGFEKPRFLDERGMDTRSPFYESDRYELDAMASDIAAMKAIAAASQKDSEVDPNLLAGINAALGGRQENIAQLQELMGSYPKRTTAEQTNLRPLMALADTWYGGNLAKNYEAPGYDSQMLGQINAALRGEKSGLAKDQLDKLRVMLQNPGRGRAQSDMMDVLKMQYESRTKTGHLKRKGNEFAKGVEKDNTNYITKNVLPILKTTDQLGRLNDLIREFGGLPQGRGEGAIAFIMPERISQRLDTDDKRRQATIRFNTILSGIQASYAKSQIGAAQTKQELKNIKEVLGTNWWDTPEKLMNALVEFNISLGNDIRNARETLAGKDSVAREYLTPEQIAQLNRIQEMDALREELAVMTGVPMDSSYPDNWSLPEARSPSAPAQDGGGKSLTDLLDEEEAARAKEAKGKNDK